MKMRTRLHDHGLVDGLGYLAMLVLVVVAGVNLYLPLRNWQRLNRDLAAARMRLDELKVLYPLYAELVALDSPAAWPGLVLPVPERLSEKDVATIPDRFMQIAAEGQVQLGVVSPQVRTDEAGSRYLAVELRATAPYRHLKPFLMGLAQMPVLERIDKLVVRRETLLEEFEIRTRLALEGGSP